MSRCHLVAGRIPSGRGYLPVRRGLDQVHVLAARDNPVFPLVDHALGRTDHGSERLEREFLALPVLRELMCGLLLHALYVSISETDLSSTLRKKVSIFGNAPSER